jgi:hypothetical protein
MELSTEYHIIWEQFEEASRKHQEARKAIFNLESEIRVELVRQALKRYSNILALELLEFMKAGEVQQLFTELLPIASYENGQRFKAEKIILNLPRVWVLDNIEKYAQPLLDINDMEDYRGLLHLYSLLDKDLAMRFIEKALLNDDPEIRELADMTLSRLSVNE